MVLMVVLLEQTIDMESEIKIGTKRWVQMVISLRQNQAIQILFMQKLNKVGCIELT